MSTNAMPQVTALQAQAAANFFLKEHLPDRFSADEAYLDLADNYWHVPVMLAYPNIGSIGHVGEIIVNAESETILSSTPLKEMKRAAQELYQARRGDIEAAFS